MFQILKSIASVVLYAAMLVAIWGLYHGFGLGIENVVKSRRPTWFEDRPSWTAAVGSAAIAS